MKTRMLLGSFLVSAFLLTVGVANLRAETSLPIDLISSNFIGEITNANFGRRTELVVSSNRALKQLLPGARRVNFERNRVIGVRIPDALLKSSKLALRITVDSALAKKQLTLVNYTIFEVAPCSIGIPEFSTFMIVKLPKVGTSVKFNRQMHSALNCSSN